MFRVVFEIYRRPELGANAFRERYREHAPLIERLPGVRAYAQGTVRGFANVVGPAADAISILDFDSGEDYRVADASAEMATAHRDAARFVSHVATYFVDSRDVFVRRPL